MFYLYFLTYFIFTSCLAAGETLKYALLGTSYHLTPDFPGQPDSILWKHNSNKVVEFEGGMEVVYSSYKGRITLDWKTAELEITDLRFEDSGDYELEVYINYIIHTSRFKLEVIDKVVKPTISCQKNESSSSEESKIKATLLCSAEPRKPESLMKFKWKSLGMFHIGPKLPITLGDEHDEVEYSCSVSNPLSSETASFTAKECYKDESSTDESSTDESSSVGLIVGLSISILLLLLLGIVLGVFFCKRRQKACFAPHDPEKQSPSKGTGRGTPQREETTCLLERNETFPSQQRLVQGHNKSHDPAGASLTENKSGNEGKAAQEDQMPPEGNVKEKRKLFDRGFSNDKQSPPQKGKGSSEDCSESFHLAPEVPSNPDPAGVSSQSPGEEQSDRASSKSEDSFDSASEGQNDSDQAEVSDQSSKDEKSGQKAPGLDTSPVCSENNKAEQKETGSTPASPRSDSPSQQDPGHDPDIYSGGPDPEPLSEAAEKEVQPPESSDTEEAKNQGQASTPKESPEEAPQTDLKPEQDPQSVHSVPAGQTEPGPTDGSDQSSEDDQSGMKPAPEQPGVEAPPVCSEIKTGEAKKPQTPSSSEPSSSHHENPSDSKEAQGGVTDPAVSGLDEVTAEEGGNSLPPEGATLPSGGDTTTKDHESDPKENKDLDEDGTKIKHTTPSPAPLGADTPLNSDPDADQSKENAEKVTPSDQTDSGGKNETDPADEDPSSMHPGYVKEEAEKIDKRSRDEQTLLRRGRESTTSDHLSPLSPSTRGAGAPFQPGPADKSHSDEDSVFKPPETEVTGGEVNGPLKEKSGSDQGNGDDQNQEESDRSSQAESPDVPVQKAPDLHSDKQDATKQQAATPIEEDKEHQETDNPEQSVAPTTTKVETSNTNKMSPNTANEGQSEEGEQTGPGSAERERPLDGRATEAGQGEGETR